METSSDVTWLRVSQLWRLSRYVLCAGAILYIALYAALASVRMRYPFELEWHEGLSVDQVNRILMGQQLYDRPSISYTPLIYTPLYYYVSAGIATLTGPGFLPLRLVSVAASLGCLAIIALWVKRQTRDSIATISAAGLFAATYRAGGAWLDIARVDSLFLFLTLLAIFMLACYQSPWATALAGGIFALAFLTKQTALMIFLPLAISTVITDWRRAVILGSTHGLVLGAGILLFNVLNNGWFIYYVFEVAPQQPVLANLTLTDFWQHYIIARVPIAFALTLIMLVLLATTSSWRVTLFYGMAAAGCIGSAWYIMSLGGAYDNDLLPAFAIMAVFTGMALHMLAAIAHQWGAMLTPIMGAVCCVACLYQLTLLRYDIRAQLPRQRDVAAGQQFIATLSELPGEVLLPTHGYYATLAGKRSYFHVSPISDVLNDKRRQLGPDLYREITTAIQEHRFGAIIVEETWPADRFNIKTYYTLHETIFDDPSVFWTVTGARTRPQFIYLPKDVPTPSANSLKR